MQTTVEVEDNAMLTVPVARAGSAGGAPAPRKAVLRVDGMHCAGCQSRAGKALLALAGVVSAQVNLLQGRAYIEYDPERLNPADAAAAAAERTGFAVSVLDAPGAGGGASDSLDADNADNAESGAGETAGAPRVVLSAAGEVEVLAESKRRCAEKVGLSLAWGGSILSLLFMFWPEHGGVASSHGAASLGGAMAGGWPAWAMLACSMIAGLGAGWPVLADAARSAWRWRTGMETLIALGVLASLGSGLLARFGVGGADFSMIGGMIMAFHLTGRALENRARRRATGEVAALAALGARAALLERDGGEAEVPVAVLRPGDIVRVRAGEKVPQDGEVVEGAAGVDESLVTGESLPAARRPGDPVIGGTLNVDGFLRVRVTRAGPDAFLARIVRLVEEAQSGKAPIQLLADRVTEVFVPIVLLLAVGAVAARWFSGDAAAALAGWLPWPDPGLTRGARALSAGIATLVIACPCALGLATPMALTVGLGAAARRGVLFRHAAAVQALRGVDTIILDKTGTVTAGRPEVRLLMIADGFAPAAVRAVAGQLESRSTHPAARAIAAFVERPDPENRQIPSAPGDVAEWETAPGRGVGALIDGRRWRLGSWSWAKEQGAAGEALPPELDAGAAGEGLTLAVLFTEDRLAAAFYLGDEPQPLTREVLAEIKSGGAGGGRGRRLILATGDRPGPARRMAGLLGIDEFEAEMRPEDKLALVRRLRGAGRRVAMVGDGVNDAPALKAADVGVAIGAGAEVAREAGDVLLLRGGPAALAEACRAAAAIFANIRQNLFWAFFYNLVMLPLAFSGLLHPLLAEAAMAASSLTVCLNALRLRRLASRHP